MCNNRIKGDKIFFFLKFLLFYLENEEIQSMTIQNDIVPYPLEYSPTLEYNLTPFQNSSFWGFFLNRTPSFGQKDILKNITPRLQNDSFSVRIYLNFFSLYWKKFGREGKIAHVSSDRFLV